VAFTAVASYAILKLVDHLVGLRVDREQEIEGLDIVLHEERGYNEIS
jgi:Amt family ammonium transporter